MAVIRTDGEVSLLQELGGRIQAAQPTAVGLVSAFVSYGGVENVNGLIAPIENCNCRLVAGTSHFITHPEALYRAVDLGWEVKLAQSPPAPAIFHPKLIVGGESFSEPNGIDGINLTYIGSANLTVRGFTMNKECGSFSEPPTADYGTVFKHYWDEGTLADEAAIENYAAAFADRNRRRKPVDLDELGISDQPNPQAPANLMDEPAPPQGAIRHPVAAAAWAGLQSFTGDYTFQVEFPQAAGQVLRRMIEPYAHENMVDVYCEHNGQVAPMRYRYYVDNGMFRLNVPNETPGVEWARTNRAGIILIEAGPVGGAPIRLTIYRPGNEVQEVESRSYALGTWGRTPTRLYGWY